MKRVTAAACLGLVLGLAGAARAAVEYDFAVRIDPAARTLEGRGAITVTGDQAVTLALGRRFRMVRASADGRALGPPERGAGAVQRWDLKAVRRIEVEWRGELAPLDAALDHRQALFADAPVAGAEGTFLPDASRWYPRIERVLPRYRIALELPEPHRGLVAGRLVEEAVAGGRYRARFDFPHPAEGIDLMAGPYRVSERIARSAGGGEIRLRTYFHPQIEQLAPKYLESVEAYLALYEPWIGAYPFTEFSVVSSPTPTGFGMPALTYLGIDVLRLPFIRSTSLGHEVLHNWWGNGVYPDYRRGNWAEGLTTFMADYTYKERESAAAAAEMRLAWLRDFAALPPGEDRPLAAFRSRTHGAAQIVGYHKAAMLFFMLRDAIGREAFDRGIQAFWREHRFRIAGWEDLRRSFETAAGRDLSGFFNQWLDRTGAPQVRIVEAVRAGADRVRVTVEQAAPAWRVRVPLVLRTAAGDERQWVELAQARESFTLAAAARAQSVALDPEARVLRRLAPREAPPILREAMVDPGTRTVLLDQESAARAAAEALAARLQDHAPRIVAGDAPPPGAPLLVIGLDAAVEAWLERHGQPAPEAVRARGTARAWTARRADGAALFVVSAVDAAALGALSRPLPHYGRQSYVVFDGPKATVRGVWPAAAQVVEVQ